MTQSNPRYWYVGECLVGQEIGLYARNGVPTFDPRGLSVRVSWPYSMDAEKRTPNAALLASKLRELADELEKIDASLASDFPLTSVSEPDTVVDESSPEHGSGDGNGVF